MQMIQRALAGPVERKEERALDKVGRLWNADEGRIGIELPPLNTVSGLFANACETEAGPRGS